MQCNPGLFSTKLFDNTTSATVSCTTSHGCVYYSRIDPPDSEPPLQTRILEVLVEPNPVAVGDIATFTCIISDSLYERFRFEWGLDGVFGDTITQNNKLKWVAPENQREYLHTVRADNGSLYSIAPGRSFSVTVE